MKLPAPHPVQGGIDAKEVCAKKLLEESGFVTYENIIKIYDLYLKRPRATKSDLVDIKIGSSDDTTIEKFYAGQDSEKDVFDDEYYMEGQFAEIVVFSPSLTKEEIDYIQLLNITRISTVRI